MIEAAGDSLEQLLADVDAHKGAPTEEMLRQWAERFGRVWETSGAAWTKLVERLPVRKNPPNRWPHSDAAKFLLADGDEPQAGCIHFWASVAVRHLAERRWSDQLEEPALRFVSGCLNLFRSCQIIEPPIPSLIRDELKAQLQQALLQYPGSIAVLAPVDQLIEQTDDAYSVFASRESRWQTPAHDKPDGVLLLPFPDFRGCDLDELSAFIPKLGFSYSAEPRELMLRACLFEHECLSSIFREQPAKHSRFFECWARCLVAADSYVYCWRFMTALADRDHFVTGRTVEERFTSLSDALLKNIPRRQAPIAGFATSEVRRNAILRLFRPIASLLDLQEHHRYGRPDTVEAWVRQQEALEVLNQYPAMIDTFIRGALEESESLWDSLDPIILGLEPEVTRGILESFSTEDHPQKPHYHARRLLAHIDGTLPRESEHELSAKPGLLGAVETLVAASRTRIPYGQSRLWLGDSAIEALWLGALEAAVAEFSQQFDSQFGQDEHEHVAVLVELLARRVVATNKTVQTWFQSRFSVPVFLNVSVRRFPKTASTGLPQEGGKRGVQADLAVLMQSRVPELAFANRVTLLQAKKIAKQANGAAWQAAVRIDTTQLQRLLALSSDAHYLFFVHSELGRGPLVLPARTVRDIVAAQKNNVVPVPELLRAGKFAPEFLLHDVIGLWTGDTASALTEQASWGTREGQGPRNVIEITVSREQGG